MLVTPICIKELSDKHMCVSFCYIMYLVMCITYVEGCTCLSVLRSHVNVWRSVKWTWTVNCYVKSVITQLNVLTANELIKLVENRLTEMLESEFTFIKLCPILNTCTQRVAAFMTHVQSKVYTPAFKYTCTCTRPGTTGICINTQVYIDWIEHLKFWNVLDTSITLFPCCVYNTMPFKRANTHTHTKSSYLCLNL